MSDRQTARAEADHAQGLGDSRAEALRGHGRLPQDHPPRQAKGLDPRLSGLFQEVAEHGVSVASAGVPPCVLIQVTLQWRVETPWWTPRIAFLAIEKKPSMV
jgi:hypothetical protein